MPDIALLVLLVIFYLDVMLIERMKLVVIM